MRRFAALLALFTGSVGLVAASPAEAAQRPAERVTRAKGIENDYPALTAGAPSKTDPQTCAPASFCDTIPLFIEEPKDIPLGDDFYVEIVVSWQGPVEINDLDVFLYDDGQTKAEQEQSGSATSQRPGASKYTEKFANTNQFPAKILVPEPKLGQYNLVVHNSSTSDVPYHVSAKMYIAKFQRPFEKLEDPGADPNFEDDGPPVDTSGDIPEAPPITDQSTPPGGLEGPGELDPVDPVADDELDGLRRRKGGSSDENAAGGLPAGNTRPPAPPSGLALLFWLAVVPGSLLGGFTTWLVRRRRSGFTFG